MDIDTAPLETPTLYVKLLNLIAMCLTFLVYLLLVGEGKDFGFQTAPPAHGHQAQARETPSTVFLLAILLSPQIEACRVCPVSHAVNYSEFK